MIFGKLKKIISLRTAINQSTIMPKDLHNNKLLFQSKDMLCFIGFISRIQKFIVSMDRDVKVLILIKVLLTFLVEMYFAESLIQSQIIQ